ncbi:hypothetical protein FQN60_013699 [Etheostoma spectabile]|uniref:Mif2/CENP-C cupin domain-containing protein n=1 Tax=Etheostoma spectabile TaxID=54343 RepID=A0A5J5CKW6_9PERO|nr:hypothetical protein FQN60_013699 [Etheostoma spectabile]
METNYPSLRRPKRKLCYFTNKESASKQWEGTLTLGDIDKIFDDLDPSSHDNDDILPPSTLLQTFDVETNQCEKETSPVPQEQHLTEKLPRCQMGPKGDVLQPATRSLSTKLDIDLDIPFKAHRPVKTSSPIEENMVVEELDNEKSQVVSPLLFACEDEGKEEAKTETLLIPNPQCNGDVIVEDDSQLESPPSKIVLSQPKMSSHKNKVEGLCQESHSVKEKTRKKTATPVLENKTPSSWKSLVKVPTPPPEPEDDFLILEDDRPLWFSIPSKTATNKKRRQNRTLINDKDRSTDKGIKDSPLETAQKPQDSEQTQSKLASQTVNLKTKKVKGKNEVIEPENEDELPSPEDPPAGAFMEEEKTNKKKQVKKVPSKENDKEVEQPEDRVSREMHEDKLTLKMEKKSYGMKRSKALTENGKKSKATNLKGAKKVMQGSDTVKETIGPREQLLSEESARRRRKPPGNWWAVDNRSEEVESISSPPQKLEPKPCKERKNPSKQNRSRLGTPKNGNMAVTSKPLGGSLVPLLKPTPLLTPKTVKRSLATFKDIFTTVTETPTVVSSKDAGQKKRCKVTAPRAEAVTATDCATFNTTAKDILSMDAGESLQASNCQSEGRLNPLRSGQSSMIPLEHYEEDEDLILPPPRVHAALSLSDLCGPPLKPLVLQPQDKANLREWFKSLWPIPDDKSPDITPDHFDWYSHKGRAIGFLVDLNCGSFCSGKILLGSYMKKPLWVDHSATTVFNLLSSSVSVTINSENSRLYPGPSFMVPCGHAYSIQNITAQPAVLHFTRILAESSD